ncbi:MAG: PfkB family carbohydrate kinase [Acidimicrobiales bacterium]
MSPVHRFVLVDAVVVDVVLRVDALPQRGSDVAVDESSSLAGGGFNVMAAASRLGLPAVYGGILGFGPFATIAQNALHDEGIVVALPPATGLDTGFVVALVEPDGERTFVTGNGAESTLTTSQLDDLHITQSDVVYFSGYVLLHESNAVALVDMLARLPSQTLFVFDPGPLVGDIADSHLDAVLKRVDWFTCNEREAEVLTGREPRAAAQEILSRLARGSVVVRCGPRGCVLALRDGEARDVPGFEIVALDANGAGDCHVGAFAAFLVGGCDPFEAARWANGAAALSVTRRGPATGPTMSELEMFMSQHVEGVGAS